MPELEEMARRRRRTRELIYGHDGDAAHGTGLDRDQRQVEGGTDQRLGGLGVGDDHEDPVDGLELEPVHRLGHRGAIERLEAGYDDEVAGLVGGYFIICLLYTSPSPRD